MINLAYYFDWFQAEAVSEQRLASQERAVERLAELCQHHNIVLLQPSSYRVFDGSRATAYSEKDEPVPLGVRGQALWRIEQSVRATCPQHVLLRFGWLLDDSADGILGRFLARAEQPEELLLADDRRGNPTPVDDAARVIISVLKQLDCAAPLWGTYHYAGHEATTPLALGQAILTEARALHPLAIESPTPRPTPHGRTPRKNRSTRCWPARKFCTLSIKPAPGARHSQAYWIGFIAMAEGPVLITGGAGFIGSHLTDALLAKGHSVRILDDLSTGKRSNLPLDNPALELIEGDVADAALVARVMAGCSAVAHLAAVASVQASVDDPVRTHQSNFIGTLNVCEAMRQSGVKRVLFASSAAVYGNNGEGESIDEETPKAPLTPYASDKLASEFYFDFYRRQHDLEPVVFRFFNIYGPRQDPSSPYSGVISIFSERAQKGLPITVFGDGEQTRDFVYVEDLVDLLVQAIEKPEVEVGAVNVGWNQATTLKQMLQALAAVVGDLPPISYGPARSGDIRHSRADNHRLLQRFSFPPQTPMSVGLARLLGR